jgi:hypothetical protein
MRRARFPRLQDQQIFRRASRRRSGCPAGDPSARVRESFPEQEVAEPGVSGGGEMRDGEFFFDPGR